MKSRPGLPSRVISAVEVEHVRLVEASAKTTIREPYRHAEARIITSVKLGERHKNGTFTVLPTIETQVASAKRGTPPAIVVTATFELTYRLPKAFAPTPSELTAFARTNAVFNAWPYWREFIQNMFSRMSLPPLILPLYRLGKPSNGSRKSARPAARTREL